MTRTRCHTSVMRLSAAALLVGLSAGCGAHNAASSPSGPTSPTARASATSPSPTPTPAPVLTPTPTPTTLPRGVTSETYLNSYAFPVGITAAAGKIWTASHRSDDVFELDPKTNQVVTSVNAAELTCGVPLVHQDEVWLSACDDETKVVVIDAKNAVVKGVVPDSAFSVTTTVDGSVWVPNDHATKVRRIDPATLQVQAVLPVHGSTVVSDGTHVWVFHDTIDGDFNGDIAEIDPATNQVVRTLHLPGKDFPEPVYADGALWITFDRSPALVRLDVTTGAVSSVTQPDFQPLTYFGDEPPVLGDGSIWVRERDDRVLRVDPRTSKVVGTYPAKGAGAGGDVVFAFGSLWEANFESHDVWRVRVPS